MRLHLDGQQIISKEVRPTELEFVSEERRLEHERFLRGFQVEALAYENLSEELLEANLVVPRGPAGFELLFFGLFEAYWSWRRAPKGS